MLNVLHEGIRITVIEAVFVWCFVPFMCNQWVN